jgi:hypothetical protein
VIVAIAYPKAIGSVSLNGCADLFAGSRCLAVLMLPILNEFALQHHLYNNPTEGVSMLLGYVRTISDIPHFEYVPSAAAPGVMVLSAVGDSAATSGPKHRRCKVHNPAFAI